MRRFSGGRLRRDSEENTVSPAIRTSPASGWVRPATASRIVVLPLPEGPKIATRPEANSASHSSEKPGWRLVRLNDSVGVVIFYGCRVRRPRSSSQLCTSSVAAASTMETPARASAASSSLVWTF